MARAEKKKKDSTWKMVKYECLIKIFVYLIKKAASLLVAQDFQSSSLSELTMCKQNKCSEYTSALLVLRMLVDIPEFWVGFFHSGLMVRRKLNRMMQQ